MTQDQPAQVAIVDYGLGNLFSVAQACIHVGLEPHITASPREIENAKGVIIPGVGAFGSAMETLTRLDLVSVLQDVAASDAPLLGICLGAQLLLDESDEFGAHAGLGIIRGRVASLGQPHEGARVLKVPQVGWNRVARSHASGSINSWSGTLLDGQDDGTFMYFVHSYVMKPENNQVVLSVSTYGDVEFCSGMERGNVTAFQFHPERSGPEGLRIYQRLAERIRGF